MADKGILGSGFGPKSLATIALGVVVFGFLRQQFPAISKITG